MIANRRGWSLVAVLWLAFCLNFADRQVIFSIFPLLKSELAFTDSQLGLTSSVFLWIYAICSPVAGLIGDRVPKPLLLTLSVGLWSAVTFLTGISQGPVFLLTCRALIGVTESLFYPAAAAAIANAHGSQSLSRAMALFNSGSVFGSAAGGWYGGAIAEQFHWRLAFYSLGIVGILYCLPLARFLKAVPATAPAHAIRHSEPVVRAVASFFRTPSYLMLAAVYAVFSFSVYLLYTWLPTFLTEKFGLGQASAGFTATAYLNSGSVAGLLAGGWCADYFFRYTHASRPLVVAGAVCLAAPCIYAVGAAPSLKLTITAAIGFGLCTGMYMSNLLASAMNVVAPDRRSSATGFLNLVGAFFSGFAGLLGGIFKKTIGVDDIMIACSAACLAAGILLIVVTRLAFERDYQLSK